ncbi:uncharacterized protein LOC142356127, partial [Convolutriloba macropyga]|uniref:uncharacterized protein LOC142356127 n=1 Tax=Convolutriloba macropyga TaxID=536237 RepID=UPI003F51E0C0
MKRILAPAYQYPKVSSRVTQDWKRVQFHKAPEGTFPVFTARGTFPGTEMQNFQPEKFNYSPPLKEYSVMVGAEIPLMRCDTERYKQASHSLIPTFEIPLMSAFIINTEKKAGGPLEKKPMYVLPAGHYRQMMESESYELQCWALPHLYISQDERWWVHEINPGYFFHNGCIYFLPHGWIICKERVKLQQLLAAHNELKRTKENTLHHFTRQKYHDIFSGRVLPPNRVGDAKREYEQFLNDHELNSVIKWHSTKLHIDPMSLFSAFHSFAHPVLKAILKHEKVDRDMIKQEIEVYMHYIQIYRLGYYYGPAPPYSYLKGLPSIRKGRTLTRRNENTRQHLQVPGNELHTFSNFLGDYRPRHTSARALRRLSSTRSSAIVDEPTNLANNSTLRSPDYESMTMPRINGNFSFDENEFGLEYDLQNPDGFENSFNQESSGSVQ